MVFITDWLFNTRSLYDTKNKHKDLIIYSNLVFLIIVILIIFLKKDKLKNNKLYTISLLLILLMGIISSVYHYHQCYDNNIDNVKHWLKCDVIFAIILCILFFILYYKNVNIFVIILIIFSLYLFIDCCSHNHNHTEENKDDKYIYMHSLWHIVVALIVFILIIRD